jgi:large subunit ribosomal protein L15
MAQNGLINKLYDGVKILGDGDVGVALTVRAHKFSKTARAKLEAAGGTVEILERGWNRPETSEG